MNEIERCRRIAAAVAYRRTSNPVIEHEDANVRFWSMIAPAAVLWGVVAFCVVLLESRKWVF